MKTVTYILPSHWASYLINGDSSGLSDADKRECDEWHTRNGISASAWCDCKEEYFARSNDFTWLAGNVCEFSFLEEGEPDEADDIPAGNLADDDDARHLGDENEQANHS